jgi:hypothetical protein
LYGFVDRDTCEFVQFIEILNEFFPLAATFGSHLVNFQRVHVASPKSLVDCKNFRVASVNAHQKTMDFDAELFATNQTHAVINIVCIARICGVRITCLRFELIAYEFEMLTPNIVHRV